MQVRETKWAEGEAEMQCTPRGSEEPLVCSGAGRPQSCHERNGRFIPSYQPITGARQREEQCPEKSSAECQVPETLDGIRQHILHQLNL